MSNLAKNLAGCYQGNKFAKGGVVEKKEPRREERREAKLSPKARAKVEKSEKHKCGGKVGK